MTSGSRAEIEQFVETAGRRPNSGFPGQRLRLHAAVLCLVFAVCGRFYVHLAADEHQRLTVSTTPLSYYSQLAAAFRHGQLSLLTPPKPELLALRDPYMPELNAPYRMHDVSLYRGRYYLYFGPVPALVLHLPFHLLTGYYPMDGLAVLIFLMAGLAFWLAVFHSAIGKWFPHINVLWTLAGGLAIAFCSTGPFVLARPAVYEVCLASAYCFTAIFFKALMSAVTGGAWRRNLLAAGVALSLAIASRPPAVLILPLAAAALLWRPGCADRRRSPASWPGRVRQLLPFLIPLTVAGGLLATYNYLRFENPLQFGNAYQLAGMYLRNLAFFRADRVPSGLHYYILSSHRTGGEFPFLRTAPEIPGWMPHQVAIEQVAGVLPLYPFLAALLLLPALLWPPIAAGGAGAKSDLRMMAGLLTAAGMAQLLLLCGFVGITMRYELEFLPPLVMAAVLAICLLAASPWRWRWTGVVLVPALFVGALQGGLLGFTGYYDTYEKIHRGSTADFQARLLPLEKQLARWIGGSAEFGRRVGQ